MNFLGIGPGEVFFILILLLVVVGPERLPEFARQAGRLVVRLRNWIARSPDAQMVLRAREELEQELAEIRRSLTEEVETVRKELESVRGDLAEAARMVEESADQVAKTKVEFELTDSSPAQPAIAEPAPAAIAEPAPADAIETAEAAGSPPLQAVAENSIGDVAPLPENGQPVPRSFKPGQAPPASAPAAAAAEPAAEAAGEPADDVVAALSRRIQTLGEEFSRQIQQLTDELQALRDAQAAQPAPPAELALAETPPTELAPAALAPAELAPAEPAPAEPPSAEALLAEPLSGAADDAGAPAVTLVAAGSDTNGLKPAAPEESRRRCKGVTRSGEPCAAAPLKGQEFCRAHAARRVLEEVA